MYGEEGGGRFETPANVMTSSALSRLINSDEIPSVVVEKKSAQKKIAKNYERADRRRAGAPRGGHGLAGGGPGRRPATGAAGRDLPGGLGHGPHPPTPAPPPPASTAFVPAPGGG